MVAQMEQNFHISCSVTCPELPHIIGPFKLALPLLVKWKHACRATKTDNTLVRAQPSHNVINMANKVKLYKRPTCYKPLHLGKAFIRPSYFANGKSPEQRRSRKIGQLEGYNNFNSVPRSRHARKAFARLCTVLILHP